MQFPLILQGESRVRLFQGAVIGCFLTMALGFGLAGWEFESNAQRTTDRSVTSALVAALTPICVQNFQHATDAKATLVALKATDSWRQDSFVEKGGWATFPGNKEPNSGVAEACARILSGQK